MQGMGCNSASCPRQPASPREEGPRPSPCPCRPAKPHNPLPSTQRCARCCTSHKAAGDSSGWRGTQPRPQQQRGPGLLHGLGHPGHGGPAPAMARSLPVSLAIPAKPPPQLLGEPGDGETEARRDPAQPGGERGGLTSPGSALGGEEEQQTPEEEGEGTRPGKHRSPAIGARGLRSRCPGVSRSRCPGVPVPDVPVRCPVMSRCRWASLSLSVPGGLGAGVGCLGASLGAGGCRCPGVPVPGGAAVAVPVPGGAGAGARSDQRRLL